jgi:ubiquinone/menaquinone biosynthesis C-methylase UbiE
MTGSVSFDRAAGYYDRTRAMPPDLMARLLPMIIGEIATDGRCLEIGVGTGRIALALARAGIDIVGIDLSRDMLLRLVGNAQGAAPPVFVADGTRLPFKDSSFATALAPHVLHLIPDWREAVAELRRVVRPGGRLLATRGGRRTDWRDVVIKRFFTEAGDPPWPPGVDRIEQLDEHLRGLGAAVRALPVLMEEGTSSVNDVLATLEAGFWSACWSLDGTTRVRSADAARSWARQEMGDLDEPRATRASTVWHVYDLP